MMIVQLIWFQVKNTAFRKKNLKKTGVVFELTIINEFWQCVKLDVHLVYVSDVSHSHLSFFRLFSVFSIFGNHAFLYICAQNISGYLLQDLF